MALLVNWETPPFKSSGNSPFTEDTEMPAGVQIKVHRFSPPGNDSNDWEYNVDIYIKRSPEEMKFKHYPYMIAGEFIFSGLDEETKKNVRNGVPFSKTVAETERKCEWFVVTIGVPKNDNSLWPKCNNARIGVSTKLAQQQQQQNFASSLKHAKDTHDMWLSGVDGRSVGLHECVAKMQWSNVVTESKKTIFLKSGSHKSVEYVVALTYDLPFIGAGNVNFMLEVYDICLLLGFKKYLAEIETNIVSGLKDDLSQVTVLVQKYPNVKTFQQRKVSLVADDVLGYMEMMDNETLMMDNETLMKDKKEKS